MKKLLTMLFLLFFSFGMTYADSAKWQTVENIFGKKGIEMGEIFKETFPRSDLDVKVGRVSIEPGLALTSWIGFQPMNSGVMMMGDLVLLNREVPPIIDKLLSEGIQITALHNHLIGESPEVMYLHFFATGEPDILAQKMKGVLLLTQTPLHAQSNKIMPAANWKNVESILGRTGKIQGNLLQISIPRAEVITDHGMTISPSMGTANAINFQRIGENAAATGDFVLLAREVNPVIKALFRSGIMVTAVHNHMLTETPRLFMLHFWGVAKPEKLAQGIKAALDEIRSKN